MKDLASFHCLPLN